MKLQSFLGFFLVFFPFLGICQDLPDRELEALLQEAEQEAQRANQKKESTFQKITQKLNEFNPRITLFGDAYYQWSDRPIQNEEGDVISRKFWLREVEVDFRADVDPYAKGVVILALEQEVPNHYDIAVEEGYVVFDTLPFGFRLQVGKFRPRVGILNKLHQHDLLQTILFLFRSFLVKKAGPPKGYL